MEKLKTCPFCGGKAKIISNFFHGEFYIECEECFCVLGLEYNFDLEEYIGLFDTENMARSKWNERSTNNSLKPT